jgi:hypothetical protein
MGSSVVLRRPQVLCQRGGMALGVQQDCSCSPVLAAGSYTDGILGGQLRAGQARRTGRLTAAPRPLVVGGGADQRRFRPGGCSAVAGLWGPVKE